MKIKIITGQSNNVLSALADLEHQINNLLCDYQFIGSVTITIDREVSSVSRSVIVYATQVLERK